MVWTTVLLVVVLVLGRGEAYSELRCDDDELPVEDELSLRGFFVDPDRQTRVFLRIRLNEKVVPYYDCFLQHEDGPLSPAGGERTGLVGRCRDPVTGRDHVIVSRSGLGSGSIPAQEYWSIQPDTERTILEYQESDMAYKDEAFLMPRPSRDAAGQCLWRKYHKARETFDGAMAALQIGGSRGEEPLNIAEGETLALPTREIPDAVVRHWLRALSADPFVLVGFETARSDDGSSGPPWRIIQILGRQLCDAPGVVLLQDTRSGHWRSIYDVPSGCSKSLNFPLREMRITGDTLFAKFCTDCSFWGRYGKFRLDLPTNRVTRLEGEVSSLGRSLPLADPLAFVEQDGSDTPRAADAAR